MDKGHLALLKGCDDWPIRKWHFLFPRRQKVSKSSFRILEQLKRPSAVISRCSHHFAFTAASHSDPLQCNFSSILRLSKGASKNRRIALRTPKVFRFEKLRVFRTKATLGQSWENFELCLCVKLVVWSTRSDVTTRFDKATRCDEATRCEHSVKQPSLNEKSRSRLQQAHDDEQNLNSLLELSSNVRSCSANDLRRRTASRKVCRLSAVKTER